MRRVESGEIYARMAPAYEMLASPARIEAESRAIVSHLRSIGARKVLDAGCAVGMHTLSLARLGFRMVGVDLSPAMIREARRRASGVDPEVRFLERDLRDLARVPGKPFDAVLCLGNTMASMAKEVDRVKALRSFRAALRPGGLLMLQLRDLSSIRKTGYLFPPRSHRRGEEEWILLRRQEPHPRGIRFLSILLYRPTRDAAWEMGESETIQPVLGPSDWLQAAARSGFSRIRLAEDLLGTPRKRGRRGPDLVLFARREG